MLSLYNDFLTPFNAFERLAKEMQLLSDERQESSVAVNSWVNEDQVKLDVQVPGFSQKDLSVDLHDDVLVIKGEKKEETNGEKEAVQRSAYRSFTRRFHLPYSINADGVKAKVENGILSVELPREENDKPRKIAIS